MVAQGRDPETRELARRVRSDADTGDDVARRLGNDTVERAQERINRAKQLLGE